MMRDDVLKRRMRAGMPHPTPYFSGRVRKELDRLPERKKNTVLHALPVAAMALVAVAVIGIAFMSRLGPGNHGGFNALAGGEATAAAEATPAPTPEEGLAAEETLIPTETPMETVELTPDPTPEEAQETAASGQSTPAPTPTPNQDTAQITSAPQTTALSSSGDVVGGSGSGEIAFGNSCDFIRTVINDTGTYYEIKGHTTDELLEYCDRYYTASKNGPFTKYELDPTVYPGLFFVLVDGQVDESFVGTTISKEKLNLLIAANDDDKSDGVYVRGLLNSAMLEFSGDTFVLTIRNTNPDFRPTSNFTVLTLCNPEDGKTQYFTLPVKGR